jgi:hypothetical protein
MLNRIFDLANIHDKITNFSPAVKQQYYAYLINSNGQGINLYSQNWLI